MALYLISILLVAIAGACRAVMDTLQFHYNESIFNRTGWRTFFDPQWSCKNKYKGGEKENGARFLGSTGVFVFVTDAWHLAQFSTYSIIFAVFPITLYIHPPENPLIAIGATVGLSLVFKSSFRLFYNVILRKKK